MSTALLTDMYELTMVDSAIASGTAGRRSVFEVFARRLPGERRYGVVAGTGRVVEAVRDFRFGPEEIAYLESAGIVSERTLEWMEGYRFTGDVYGYAEGECYFPHSPVLTVLGTPQAATRGHIVDFVHSLHEEHPEDVVTVFYPRLLVAGVWEGYFLRRSLPKVVADLRHERGVILAEVPYLYEAPEETHD